VANLERQLAQQQASMYEQQKSWVKQRDDLTQQVMSFDVRPIEPSGGACVCIALRVYLQHMSVVGV